MNNCLVDTKNRDCNFAVAKNAVNCNFAVCSLRFCSFLGVKTKKNETDCYFFDSLKRPENSSRLAWWCSMVEKLIFSVLNVFMQMAWISEVLNVEFLQNPFMASHFIIFVIRDLHPDV